VIPAARQGLRWTSELKRPQPIGQQFLVKGRHVLDGVDAKPLARQLEPDAADRTILAFPRFRMGTHLRGALRPNRR